MMGPPGTVGTGAAWGETCVAAAAEVGTGVVSTTGFLTSVDDSTGVAAPDGPFFFSA